MENDDSTTQKTTGEHFLSNELYDRLKTFALIILPALTAFYVALAAIWGLPAGEEVSGTSVALITFLGVLIKIGDMSYNASEARFDGDMVIETKHSGGKMFNLELKGDPAELENQDEVVFKVVPEEGRSGL